MTAWSGRIGRAGRAGQLGRAGSRGGLWSEGDAERGSGTVLVLVLVIVGGFLMTVTLGLAAAIQQRHRAGVAADLAALAAVDAVTDSSGGAPGDGSGGCAEARRVAAANSALLDGCRWLADDSVLVHVRTRGSAGQFFGSLDLQAAASARAGPGPMTTR